MTTTDNEAPGLIKAPQVPGHILLDDTEAFIRRFAVMGSDYDYASLTVWCAHTWLFRSFDVSPRGAILSDVGVYGVGKTRVMELAGLFCRNFRLELDPTGPALAAMISQLSPTIGIDETDTIFGARGSAGAKRQLRGILNSGYKAGAKMSRRSKNDFVEDVVYCPVIFAGAANLPDSLMSRSIVWHMKPRRPEQKIEAWFPRMHAPEGQAIGEALGQWCGTVAREVSTSWPDLPEGIEDRASEIWWPLIAIADAAGGEWPRKIRESARAMVLREAAEAKAPPGVPAPHGHGRCMAAWRDRNAGRQRWHRGPALAPHGPGRRAMGASLARGCGAARDVRSTAVQGSRANQGEGRYSSARTAGLQVAGCPHGRRRGG